MFQVAWGYGLFTGGLGGHGGCETLGACAIPASSGNTARQIQLLCDLPVIGIGCTPSYALVLAERLREENRRPKALKYAICGAEAWTREMREELEELFGVIATNIYGLTEIIGPGVAQECLEKQGLHVQEDHFLAEIIDPDTGKPLADGERGELVITTLTREAMPVLRYRTRDLTSMVRETCACGRTTARIDWFTGRVDDMLVIRGVNVFPSAIEEVLLRFPELSPNYRIFVDRPPNGLDTLLVEVEHHPGAAVDDAGAFARTVTPPAVGDAAGVAGDARRGARDDRADRGREGQARHRPEKRMSDADRRHRTPARARRARAAQPPQGAQRAVERASRRSSPRRSRRSTPTASRARSCSPATTARSPPAPTSRSSPPTARGSKIGTGCGRSACR